MPTIARDETKVWPGYNYISKIGHPYSRDSINPSTLKTGQPEHKTSIDVQPSISPTNHMNGRRLKFIDKEYGGVGCVWIYFDLVLGFCLLSDDEHIHQSQQFKSKHRLQI